MGALAANIALVPRWFSFARPKQTPWRVFALGLAGGLLALFAGPLLLPSSQAWFFVYGLVIAAAFVIAWKAKDSAKDSDSPAPRKTPLTAALALRWILLAAIPSGLMQSLASVWAADATAILALYFATLALAFAGLPDVFVRATRLFIPLPLIAVGVGFAAVFVQTAPNLAAISLWESAFFLVAFVVAAQGCHCELARQKPDVSSLSFFVLAVALGAALGGFALELFAQKIAFAVGLILAGLLIGAQAERNTSERRKLHPHVAAAVATLLVGVALSWSEPAGDSAEAFSQLRGPLYGN